MVTLILTCFVFAAHADAKVEKLKLGSGGYAHTYYLYIPDQAAAGPAPLLILLHGSGRDGRSLIDPWLAMSKREGIVLVAPDASDPKAWRMPQEGPEFFHELIETVVDAHKNIDRRRVYVFGHSAGAIQGLDLGVLEPDAETRARVPHHLLGTAALTEGMSAGKFCRQARRAIAAIQGRGKPAIVVGGSGLYVRALLDGMDDIPPPDPELRQSLAVLPVDQLVARLKRLDRELGPFPRR